MLGISDDSTNSDSAVLAVARLLQQRLDTAPLYGGEIDELLKSFALVTDRLRERGSSQTDPRARTGSKRAIAN
jgi:hypothetical protein